MISRNVVLLTLLFFLTGCRQRSEVPLSYPQPLNDHWEIATPGESEFFPQKLEKLLGTLAEENPKLNSLVIARHGKLVVDQYFNGYTPDSLQKIWSITKAITAAVIGVATDRGLLSEEDSIGKYLGAYGKYLSPSAKDIRIEHLLSMTSGYEWVELGGPQSAGFQLAYSKDWVAFALSQPHTGLAGKTFNYSTGNSMVLAPIIKNATGQQADEFADTHIFKPLGITNYQWDRQSEFWTNTQSGELPGARLPEAAEYERPFADLTNTGSGLHMRPRDLCKFGQLYLNKGSWKGKQVISETWIDKSVQPYLNNSDYAYHWKLMEFNGHPCYFATGFGLQRIFLFPDLDMVIVMTQQHYESMPQGERWTQQFLGKLLAAMEDS